MRLEVPCLVSQPSGYFSLAGGCTNDSWQKSTLPVAGWEYGSTKDVLPRKHLEGTSILLRLRGSATVSFAPSGSSSKWGLGSPWH